MLCLGSDRRHDWPAFLFWSLIISVAFDAPLSLMSQPKRFGDVNFDQNSVHERFTFPHMLDMQKESHARQAKIRANNMPSIGIIRAVFSSLRIIELH